MRTRFLIAGIAFLTAACASSISTEFPPILTVPEASPDDVDAVLFLLGDAGYAYPGQSPVMAELTREVEWWSEQLARDSAVAVAYLGDVVYPDGVHERSDPSFPQDSTRLWSQIHVVTGPNALRHKTLGLFLAGNHDWGNMTGDRAQARLANLRAELDSAAAYTGAPLSLNPPFDDPGPVVRDIRENVRVLFFDTHWWLQERSEEAKTAFFQRVQAAVEGAGDREVIILAHHPWASAGPHGVVASGTRSIGLLYLLSKSGTYVQDVNSPANGDLRNRLKATFRAAGKVPLVFAAGHDHSLQVISGRDEEEPRHILVSGAGSKLSSIEDTTSLRHAAVQPGYMRLVFRRDDSVDLYVSALPADYLSCPEDEDERVECMAAAADSFQTIYSDRLLGEFETTDVPEVAQPDLNLPPTDTLPPPPDSAQGDELPRDTGSDTASATDSSRVEDGNVVALDRGGTEEEPPDEDPEKADPEEADPEEGEDEDEEDPNPPPPAVDPDRISLYNDSVMATPGRRYEAGFVHRFFMGGLHRDLWDIPFQVAVLNLDAVGGSLEPDELSGGRQTLGLKFDGADGRRYQFRSIVKDASRAIPRGLRTGPIDDALQDQMAAQFPLSAMVVAELVEAAGILIAKPRPVVMPDDSRLGEYRDLFAGRMGWIEERPDELDGDLPGFAGSSKVTGTTELYDELRKNPESFANGSALLKARLIDMFVGDWDRHFDNWRWASFEEGDRIRWDPIPRDRDWALTRLDGVVPSIARIYYPKYVSFDGDYPSINGLNWAAQNFDRRLLNQMTRADFERAAESLQAAYTDEVLEQAVGVLPEPYQAEIGNSLLADLKSRRDGLRAASIEFYELLSRWVDVRATDGVDRVTVERQPDENVLVTIQSGDDAVETFRRSFHPDETNEVRIYLFEGDDLVEIADEGLPIDVKIVLGPGEDRVSVEGTERPISAEGFSEGSVQFFLADPAPVDTSGLDEEEAEELELAGQDADLTWERRDWGHQWIPLPAVDYASEFGLHLGGTIIRRGFGFGAVPYAHQFSLTVLGASSPSRLVVEGAFENPLGTSDWYLNLEGRLLTQRLTRFFGLGNETTNLLPQESYETRRSLRNVELLLGRESEDDPWAWWMGPRVRRWGRTDVPDPVVFQLFPVQGSTPTVLIGGVAGASRDTRDDEREPRSGGLIELEIAGYPALADVDDPWMGLRLDATRYLSSDGLPMNPALQVGVHFESVGASAPYFERASLGGRGSLPGYRTGRFRGDEALSVLSLARLQLLDADSPFGGFALGVHGIGTAGRVWLDGETSDAIHTAAGGGLWIRPNALGAPFSVSMVWGERGPRTYLDLGFLF